MKVYNYVRKGKLDSLKLLTLLNVNQAPLSNLGLLRKVLLPSHKKVFNMIELDVNFMSNIKK